MTAVGAADRGNLRRMPRSGKPVMNRGPDTAPLNGCLAGPMVSGDEQDHAFPAVNRALECSVDRLPGAVEIHAMEIEHPIRLNRAASDAALPSPVERSSKSRRCRCGCLRSLSGEAKGRGFGPDDFRLLFPCLSADFLSRERRDRRGHARPKRCFFRAERAHEQPHPWGARAAPARMRTFLQRSR